MNEIRIYKPDISYKEIYYASKTIFKGWLGYGEEVNIFKQKISEKLKLNNEKTVTFNNATNALFTLFKVLKLNGEVIIPSIVYPGTANAIIESGSRVNICDVEDDLNPSLFNIRNAYNKHCKALVINNYAGVQPEELYKIKNFCKEKNMLLIEDRACNLIGGKNNHLADFIIYSFNSMKILTTIEGGMLYVNNNKYINLLDDIKLYNSVGIKKNLLTNNFNYTQDENVLLPGNKSLISSVGASIGLAQIERLDEMIEKRLKNEQRYYNQLEHNFYVPKISYYPKGWYWIRTNKDKKQKIIIKMMENKINVNFKYYPLHMTKFYQKDNKKLIKSEEMHEQVLCLPIHSKLKKEEIDKICKILNLKY